MPVFEGIPREQHSGSPFAKGQPEANLREGSKMRMILRAAVLTVGLSALVWPTSAQAVDLTFDQIEQGGVVDFDSVANTYVGTDIIFESISDGTTTVYCGTVDPNTGETDTNCLLNFDIDADTLTGTFVLSATNGLYDSDGNLLFAGTLGANEYTILTGQTITSIGTSGSILGIEGTDTKLAELLDYFGLTGDWIYVNSEFKSATDTWGENTPITQADLQNQGGVPVPEPAMMMLFGLGLAGIGRGLARRRRD
jgi:hypothetical protein